MLQMFNILRLLAAPSCPNELTYTPISKTKRQSNNVLIKKFFEFEPPANLSIKIVSRNPILQSAVLSKLIFRESFLFSRECNRCKLHTNAIQQSSAADWQVNDSPRWRVITKMPMDLLLKLLLELLTPYGPRTTFARCTLRAVWDRYCVSRFCPSRNWHFCRITAAKFANFCFNDSDYFYWFVLNYFYLRLLK